MQDVMDLVSANQQDTIESVLERIQATGASRVLLDLPDGATCLVDLQDFRLLRRETQERGIEVILSSDDAYTRSLGSILGFETRRRDIPSDGVPPPATENTERHDDYPTRKHMALGRKAVETSPPAESPPADPPPDLITEQLPDDYESPDDEHDGAATLRNRLGGLKHGLGQLLHRTSELATTLEQPAPEKEPAEDTHDRSARRSRILKFALAAVALMLVLAAGAAATVVFVLPTATIAITPSTQVVDQDVIFGVGLTAKASGSDIGPGQGLIASTLVPSQKIEIPLVVTMTAPASGQRMVPDKTATGVLRIVNAGLQPVEIPSGTQLATASGVAFSTTEAGQVDGANPLLLSYGVAEIPIQANVAGLAGNVDEGAIQGQFANGAYYINVGPVTGGTERPVSVVAQTDLDSLNARAEKALRDQGPTAIRAALAAGQRLIGTEVVFSNWGAIADKKTGDDAEQISLSLKTTASALAYRTSDVEKTVSAVVQDYLASRESPGVTLLSGPVKYDDPVPAGTTTSVAVFRTRVSAQASYQIDKSVLDKIAAGAPGKRIDQLEKQIAALPFVNSYQIRLSSDPLSRREMPRFASKISVVLNGASGEAN